jgi:hypothetical protein
MCFVKFSTLATTHARNGNFHLQVRIASFPTRTMPARWATKEAQMIGSRHFRNACANRRPLGEVIDKHVLEVAPKKRNVCTGLTRQRWGKDRLGHLMLADITSEDLTEHKGKRETESSAVVRCRSSAKGAT